MPGAEPRLSSVDQNPDKPVFSGDPTASSLLSLLARIPALLWSTDLELQFNFLTGAGLQALGMEAGLFAGKRIDALFSGPATGAGPLRAHRSALEGTACSFDVAIGGRNLEAHVEPLRAPGGAIVGVIGLALDTTDRIVAENALRISEQSYRSLIEEAPYGICRATESGQLLQANRAMLEMLGYDPGSEADLLLRDLPQIFISPEGFRTFQQELARNGTAQGLEDTWLRRDGSEIRVRIGGRAIRDLSGSLLYFDLLAENVTEKRELEARLQQAQKIQAIGQLAGGIAHDFNNLLTIINGYCDLLLQTQEEGAAREEGPDRQSLMLIRQAGARAAGLTRQLLTFSRKQISQPRPIHLNTCAAEVLEMTSRLIGENILVTQSFDPLTGSVLADMAQLTQMLMNLVINARDAMADGGRLDIATSCEEVRTELSQRLDVAPGKYAVLKVSDTGVGMDERVRAHLFEPFFTTKPVGEGTGLGLATVYGVVRQAGGAITVDSRPGSGTTFRVYLPQMPPEDPAPESNETQRAQPNETSTILVVEDEPAVRRFVKEVLASSGYHVLEAADADEALTISNAYQLPIHLLLADMAMPGSDGRDLAIRLKQIHPESRVILVSGYSESLAADETIGSDLQYLAKPFTPGQLSKIVRAALNL